MSDTNTSDSERSATREEIEEWEEEHDEPHPVFEVDHRAERQPVKKRTRVGHCKQDETDVYAGRGPDGRNMLGSRVGQRGWLGNPHRVEENGRELSIEKFRIDFEQKLARDPTFAAAVADLSGSVLGCWCQRLDEDEPACHAEIIAEHADRLARDLHTGSEQEAGR